MPAGTRGVFNMQAVGPVLRVVRHGVGLVVVDHLQPVLHRPQETVGAVELRLRQHHQPHQPRGVHRGTRTVREQAQHPRRAVELVGHARQPEKGRVVAVRPEQHAVEAFRVAGVKDRIAFGAALDALVNAGQEACAEGVFAAVGLDAAGNEDDEAGEVFIFRTEAVGDPRTHRGTSLAGRTGEELTRAADLLIGIDEHFLPLRNPADRAGHGVSQRGFSHTGHVLDQDMASREQAAEGQPHLLLFSEQDGVDRLLRVEQARMPAFRLPRLFNYRAAHRRGTLDWSTPYSGTLIPSPASIASTV